MEEEKGSMPRILIIDSYDSFTYNLAALVSNAIPSSQLYIIKNDELDFHELRRFLPYFSAVLVGPGPGSPAIPTDIGIVKDLWKLEGDSLLPIFGVCLGLQSLGMEHGASLKKLHQVKHGFVSPVFHNGDPLFAGISNGSRVVRYHSLCIDLDADCSKLAAIAWTDDGEMNGRVIMGLRHTTKPFYAVQYHPESVCTDGSGLTLLSNFWHLASQWNNARNRVCLPWDGDAVKRFPASWPSAKLYSYVKPNFQPQKVTTSVLSLPQLSVTQVCEVLGAYKTSTDFVLLDSAASPGRFSIIGCIHPNTLKITYSVGDDYITMSQGRKKSTCSLGSSDIWTWLGSFMRTKEAFGGDETSPFWGGLIGYLSYELGVDSLRVQPPRQVDGTKHPDVNLVYVERSLVVDNHAKKIYLQSLIPKDDDWFAYTASNLKRAAYGAEKSGTTSQEVLRTFGNVVAELPDKAQYISRIQRCQEYLSSGESYELCLTARTKVCIPRENPTSSQSSWDLYKKVRSVNPAPYSAYLRLYPSTLVSSSPERFISYSRPPHQKLQLRPIKGTVRKGDGVTREMAEEILSSQKEVGENLMIVDLIRHDLHGVLGKNVHVKKFCGIEEYKTVWQLVSVIEGDADANGTANDDVQLGWEALSRSLPPGSMTGAPKKRSVQILQSLEDDKRSIYSGVVGYWSVGGSGDWSVVIRSLYNCDPNIDGVRNSNDQDAANQELSYDEWFVGAGGAITALSDPEAEWDEMVVKLQSVLRAFDVQI